MTEPKFKHRSKVRINSGYYRGITGVINGAFRRGLIKKRWVYLFEDDNWALKLKVEECLLEVVP